MGIINNIDTIRRKQSNMLKVNSRNEYTYIEKYCKESRNIENNIPSQIS